MTCGSIYITNYIKCPLSAHFKEDTYGPPLSGSRTQTGMPPVFREDTRTIVAVETTLKNFYSNRNLEEMVRMTKILKFLLLVVIREKYIDGSCPISLLI